MAERGDTVAVKVRIRGRVQGVAFRAWTMDEAIGRGLRGWVRNRRDGSVEAVFAGEPALVEDMVEACRRGPPAARVASVDREPAADPGGSGFHLLETA